jgi:hypothetical protein
LIVGDYARVERDLTHFSVTCSARAYFFVARVFYLSTGITTFYLQDSIHLLVHGLNAPKATGAEGGDFN